MTRPTVHPASIHSSGDSSPEHSAHSRPSLEHPGPRLTQLVWRRIHSIDPGLARARTALRSLLVLLLGGGGSVWLLSLAGQSSRAGMIGGMLPMMSVMMVPAASRSEQLRQIGRLLLTALVSGSIAAGLSAWPLPSYAGFLAIIAGAAWVQRWGPKGIGVGMIAFMAHFNVLFLKVTPVQIPWVAMALLLGFFALALVIFVLVPDREATRVRRIIPGFRARILYMIDQMKKALEKGSFEWGTRRLVTATGSIQETAIAIDTALENPVARRYVADPGRLRDHAFVAEVLSDHLAAMVAVALRSGDESERRELARQIERSMPALLTSDGITPATADLLPPSAAHHSDRASELISRLGRAIASVESAARVRTGGAGGDDTSDAVEVELPSAEEAVTQSAATTKEPEGLSPATRKMIQVTLAGALSIIVGMWFSETYWYYAVIGAFFTLLTTTTRGASMRRAIERILGTAIGVLGGVGLATLLTGSVGIELTLIVALAFIAFWFFQASNLVVVILFTSIIALVYDLMGVHTLELLMVRLWETLIGASFGGLAAFLVLPVSTRQALDESVVRALGALDGVLAALDPRGSGVVRDLLFSRLRELNQAFSAFRAAGKPLASPLPIGSARTVNRDMLLMSALRYRVRDLVAATTGTDGSIQPIEAESLPALDLIRRRAEWIRHRLGATEPSGQFTTATDDDERALAGATGRTGDALRYLYQRLDAFAESRALAAETDR